MPEELSVTVNCLRCGQTCRTGAPDPQARAIRQASEGLCPNCMITKFLLSIEPIKVLIEGIPARPGFHAAIPPRGPEILLGQAGAPARQQIAAILQHTQMRETEIDWIEVVGNWSLLEHRTRGIFRRPFHRRGTAQSRRTHYHHGRASHQETGTRLKTGKNPRPAAFILHELEIDDGYFIRVIGDPDNGGYEWVIERPGPTPYTKRPAIEFSNVGYGITEIALRDGMIAYYGLPNKVSDDLKRLQWAIDHPDKFQALVGEIFADENSQSEDVRAAISDEMKKQNALAPA